MTESARVKPIIGKVSCHRGEVPQNRPPCAPSGTLPRLAGTLSFWMWRRYPRTTVEGSQLPPSERNSAIVHSGVTCWKGICYLETDLQTLGGGSSEIRNNDIVATPRLYVLKLQAPV